MCMLCDDEKNYQAYMAYLDEVERQGKAADADKAMDAVLTAMTNNQTEAPDLTLSTHYPSSSDKPAAAPPSPFFCSPVDK